MSEREFARVFADEQECLLAAFEQGLERLLRLVDEAASGKRSWLERLRAGLVALLGFFDDEPGWGRLLVCETPLLDSANATCCELRVLGVLTALLDDNAARMTGDLAADPTMTSELTVGGVIAVVRARLRTGGEERFVELAPALMSFIVRPYLGQAAAQAELTGAPVVEESPPPTPMLPVRATHRTIEVLRAIANAPRSSNRQIAELAGVVDEGQISKLLGRLQARGVIENLGRGQCWGEPNAWLLTAYGQQILRRLGTAPDGQPRVYKARGVSSLDEDRAAGATVSARAVAGHANSPDRTVETHDRTRAG